MTYLIEARNICYSIDQKPILDHVSLYIQPGQLVTLIGPNGSVKSTLLKILLGLIQPNSGIVQKNKRLKIGYMPQKLFIDQTMPLSVIDFLKLSPSNLDSKQILQSVRMQSHQHSLMHTLSGGEFQKILLAKALLQKPDLLVLDEPVQGVDVVGQVEIYQLIQEVRHLLKCGILLVSHDLHFVHAASDHVICLNQHICCQGQPEDIQNNPGYLSLFGQSLQTHMALYQHHHNHRHDTKPCIHDL